MQERQRSWSAVWNWTSCRVQASFHAQSVTLEWAATASCNGCKHWVHKKCSGLKCLTKDLDYRCTRCQGTPRRLDGRTQKEVQVGLFATYKTYSQQQVAVNFQPQHVWKPPGRSSRICYQFSLHATSLSKHVAKCTALVCEAQCSMPARLGHWQSQTFSICSQMTGQWSDRSVKSGYKDIVTTRSNELLVQLGIEDLDLILKEKTPMVRTSGTLQWCSQDSLWHRLMKSVGLGGPRWHGSSWQRGIAESGNSQLSTLMIDIPGDLVWDLPCLQQPSYLEGGPLMWMLPLYLHVNQKSDYDDDVIINELAHNKTNETCVTSTDSDQPGFVQSDQSSLITGALYSLSTIQSVTNEKPCPNGWMYRFIWVFAGHTGLIVVIFCALAQIINSVSTRSVNKHGLLDTSARCNICFILYADCKMLYIFMQSAYLSSRES